VNSREDLAGGKLRLDYPAEAVARLTLNRPDARNALDHDTLDAIAEAAESIGLVNWVADDDRLADAAVELAAEIAANAPLSMKGNKHAIDTLAANPKLSDEQERELVELRRSCFASDDLREGIRAFAEKRKPSWRGR
jgi:enoyl-CoA hydratase/carnithine racemase